MKISRVISEPMLVKVGAHDGMSGDPWAEIVLSNEDWRGLLIEPVPRYCSQLRKNFPDERRFSIEQIAIGPVPGATDFYYVDERAAEALSGLPEWFNQLGSFDRGHIVKHLDGVLEPFIVRCTVEVCRLSDVLQRHGIRDVHLLHVDAEGHDYEVLKTLDFASQAPLSIFIEHVHLSSVEREEMKEFLRTYGYSVRNCGMSYFALRKNLHERLRQNP